MTSASPVTSGANEISRPRFVGRERELATLTQVGRPGATAVILIEGDAGVGKTRLLREFLASRPDPSARVVEALCPPFREPFSLGPVVDALRNAATSVAELTLTPLAGALRPMFPEWAQDLPAALEPLPDSTATRHRLFRALGELIVALDVAVLVVEDVHWADEATLEFLLFLTSSRLHDGLTLVVTYRPAEVPDGSPLLLLSSRLPEHVEHRRIEVEGLSADEIAGMVSSMLDGRAVSREFAGFLHRYSEGIPLAVEELVRLLYSRADLTLRDGSWVRRHLDDIDVPRSIRDAVLERLGRLDGTVQEVLKAAAVLSDPADEAILVEVSGLTEADVATGLAVGMGSGWLQADGRQLAFRHVLSCKAIYDAIPDPQRRAMHRRAGAALESQRPLPLVRLARHFRSADETDRWCHYAELAADHAAESGDQMTATVLLHELVVSADLPVPSLARLASKLADAALRRREAVDELHTRIVATLQDIVDSADLTPQQAAELRERRGRLLLQMGELETGHRELELAIPRLDHEPVEAARAMTFLGFPLAEPRPAAEHLAWLDRAASVTARVREPVERMALTGDRATALLMLGEDEGWAVAAELPEHAADPDLAQQLARAHANLGYAAMVWGRYVEAERWLLAAMEQAGTEHPRLGMNVRNTLARLYWCVGRWGGLNDVRVLAVDVGDPWQAAPKPELQLVAGLLSTVSGDWATAEERLRFVVEETSGSSVGDVRMSAAGALARVMLARGDSETALRVTDEPVGQLERTGIWIWATEVARPRVEALVASDRLDDAVEFVDRFRAGVEGRSAPAPIVALVGCRGLLAEAAGDHARAAAEYARAAADWAALPRPYDAGLASESLGRALLAGGDETGGVETLTGAFRDLAALDARRDADRVAYTLREYGVDVPRPWRGGSRGYGDALSPREREVARLVREGLTNREIAEALFLSPKTVARHLNSAMRKLKVSSRTALAVRLADGWDDDAVRQA